MRVVSHVDESASERVLPKTSSSLLRSMERLTYRRDIDGLRAIAVLAVIAYHSFPRALPGGFVGVDVFFVISGYLISSIIGDALTSGTFSLRGFYAARIRRIFPALISVLAVMALLGWYALLGSEYQQLGKHIAAGAGFASNLALWSEAGYFETDSALKPLLHLWSLGIEEQFYLFWPMVMWLSYKQAHALIGLTAVVVALSFLHGLSLLHSDPVAAFYLPTGRVWELLIGALLAYFRRQVAANSIAAAPRYRHVSPAMLAWFGLFCITAATFSLDRYVDYPGWWALLPTVGAAALIAAGPATWLNARVLGSRPAVAIGLISYPLYLWHWPLLSFLQIIERRPSAALTVTAVACSFVLAWLTHRYVELPVRRKRAKPVMLSLSMIMVALFGYLSWHGDIRPWSSSFGLEKIVNAPPQPNFPGVRLQPFSFRGSVFYQQGGTEKTTLIIGDSNANQYYWRFDKLLTEHPGTSRGVVYAASAGCAPIPHIHETNRRRWCGGFINNGFEYGKHESVDTIVIAANWYLYFSNSDPRFNYVFETGEIRDALGIGSIGSENAYAQLRQSIADLASRGKTIYLVLNIPTGAALDPANLVRRSLRSGFEVEESIFDRQTFVDMTAPVMQKLEEAALAGGASVIDPVDFLCRMVECPTLTSAGNPIYRDKSHLRSEFVRDHVTFLDETAPM